MENVQFERIYESWAGRDLIIAYSQQQVFLFFVSAVVGLFLLGGYFGRRAPG
jgi:hypothetical protein